MFDDFDTQIQFDEFAEWEEFNAFLDAGWEDRIDEEYATLS